MDQHLVCLTYCPDVVFLPFLFLGNLISVKILKSRERKKFFFGSHDERIYLLEILPELSLLYPDQIIIYPAKVVTSVKPF